MKPRLLLKGLRSGFYEMKGVLQAGWAPVSRLGTEVPGDIRPGFLSIIERISAGTQACLECCSVTHRRRMLTESSSQRASVCPAAWERCPFFSRHSLHRSWQEETSMGQKLCVLSLRPRTADFNGNLNTKKVKDIVGPWLRGRGNLSEWQRCSQFTLRHQKTSRVVEWNQWYEVQNFIYNKTLGTVRVTCEFTCIFPYSTRSSSYWCEPWCRQNCLMLKENLTPISTMMTIYRSHS